MAVSSIRVEGGTRDRLMRIAGDEFGGVSAETALSRLLDEHEQARQIAVMESFRAQDPVGWAAYLHEAGERDRIPAPVADTWDEGDR